MSIEMSTHFETSDVSIETINKAPQLITELF